ncbi:HEAT repeat-containing protein 1 isoform X3 [Pseudochaenichthys georgianus]|uniref:HEAT repeat-containing protein 1 isoform X3 n=1 Tax=Pseudochaenichthys georgianus TaxID=52239 RepID=UPI00146DFB03|nr:HEAT repeat-containing protein 1 isoform X3 [Pseudochaenichthys georgianus]
MTSLAQQLKRLAVTQTPKEVVSLLFDPKDAASMDRSTFYALGCTGLEVLLGIEPAFQEFKNSLFSRASLTLERSVQSKEVNEKLDAAIALFLARLCPYFLLKPAHKCIEWLVHRFHIQRYNADSLLGCALPYHNTKVFVRVLQLLHLREKTNWSWLHPVQKAGVPLSREALVSHCCSDLSFMDFICSLVTKSIQAYSGATESSSKLRVVFTFYASVIVSSLDSAKRISDANISKLLPFIHQGLSSPLPDFTAASYMLVCQLAVKQVLKQRLVEALSLSVCRSLIQDQRLLKEGLGCLTVLMQSQGEGPGNKALRVLISVPLLVSSLQEMSVSHDVSPLLKHLLPHLLHQLLTCKPGESQTELSVLENILQNLPLINGLDQTVARLLLEEYLSQRDVSAETLSSMDLTLQPLIRLLESRFCVALDGILAGHVTSVDGSDQKRLFHRFLSLSMSGGKYQILGDSDTSLLLSLKHSQPVVRVSALTHLKDAITYQQQNLNAAFLRDVVMESLQDDEPTVAAAAVKVLEVLLDVLDPEDVVTNLLSLLLRRQLSHAEAWLPVLTEAVRLLSDPRLGNGDAERPQRAGWRLLPLLVLSSLADLPLLSCLIRCPLLRTHPLTLTWEQELEALMKTRSEPDFLVTVNERLVSTMTKNISDMEKFCRRDALKKLSALVEQQKGPSLGVRTSFVVLTRVLLQVLGELSEMQHIITAQSVFQLLERPLLEACRGDNPPSSTETQEVSSFSMVFSHFLLSADQLTFSSVLVTLLRDFISNLHCPNNAFKAGVWWNPEKLDNNTCGYLSLMLQISSLLIRGASEGPNAAACRDLMKLLIQVHFPSPPLLFRFLCVMWGYVGNHGDQLDIQVDAVLQTRALYMGAALLTNQSTVMLQELSSAQSPVVPSLLCCLSSPVREVRRAGLSALQNLSASSASPFQPITEKLLKTSEEIIADPAYLSQALGVLQDQSVVSLQPLLQSVQMSCCPSYSATCLLRNLRHVNGSSVLAGLLPVLENLLDQSAPDVPPLLRDEAQLLLLILGKFSQEAAPLLDQDQNCLDLFIRVLKTQHPLHPDLPSCQTTALEQMTKPFFSALGEAVQQRLLTAMFDVLTGSRSPLVADTIRSVFKRIAVHGQLLANELAPHEKPKVKVTVQQTRRMSQRNPLEAPGGLESPEEGAVCWRRVSLILELLQNKKKLKRAESLVPVLFSLLHRSLDSSPSDDTNIEYIKQLLLSCLLNIVQKLKPEGGAAGTEHLEEEKFSVELVVQCIRFSDIPQTHHNALQLLGAAAAIYPEKVLHNIMPIFTFMGANILRLDDAYSFRVIEQTLTMVIPALIQAHQLSEGGSSPSLVAVVTRIVHVFVDALPHVPEHRRLPVLHQLVQTLSPAPFLWILMLLLFKLHASSSTAASGKIRWNVIYPCAEIQAFLAATGSELKNQKQDTHKKAALENDVEFWISLCCQFDVSDQLTSLINILNFLLQLPEDKDDAAALKSSAGQRGAMRKDEDEEVQDLIFSLETHSSKELRHFKFLCVSFMAQLLNSNAFIAKVADGGDAEDASLQPLQQKLLEEILRYINSVARCVEKNADKPTGNFWRVLLNKAYDLLDKVNSLLPTDTFITVMKGLMGNRLPSVRRKAMELLNNKLQHRTQWDEQQVTVLLQLIDDLLCIVGKQQEQPEQEQEQREQQQEQPEQETAINRQTALFSLKLLCRNLGSGHQGAFSPVLQRAVQLVEEPTEEKNVTGSAMLLIAEAVSTLKALAIPQLPRLMPAVLLALSDRKQLLTNEILLLSAVTALQRITETLPHFFSPYLQETITQVCSLTRLVESSSSSSAGAQLSSRLSSLRVTLATKLPPRVLLPTLTKCYSSMVLDRQGQLGALLSILQEHIDHMEREQLSHHQSELTSFFLSALDFRAQHCQGDLQRTSEIEGHVIDCLLAMVLKLSEVTFRPLFFKLLDWSKTGSKERLLTFFRLSEVLAEKLKSLFVLFAGNLVKPIADLLTLSNCSQTSEPLFASLGSQKVCLLLHFLLDCLYKICLYDTQRFLSRERADTLLQPLLDQMENSVGGQEASRLRLTQNLVPCLGQFSVALADDSLWKTLNYQILLKTRHTLPEVRFSSLLVLMELASKLKENYVSLLPETIPFLAELMEDECEEVEQQVQIVIQEMENILGEPMLSYF